MVNERLLMADTMTFGKLLDAANESKTGRGSGQWTPAACKAWREADPEMARMLEAAFACELGNGRIARPEDEGAVRAVRASMDEATAKAAG
jgi:hypothetical protein